MRGNEKKTALLYDRFTTALFFYFDFCAAPRTRSIWALGVDGSDSAIGIILLIPSKVAGAAEPRSAEGTEKRSSSTARSMEGLAVLHDITVQLVEAERA